MESIEQWFACRDSVSAETETADQKAEDSCGCNCGRGNELPISGTRAERYQAVMHMDLETLQGLAEPSIDPIDPIADATQRGTRSDLADGTRVSAETIRRFLCDGSIVPMVWGPDGVVKSDRVEEPGGLVEPDGVVDAKDAVPRCGVEESDAAAATNVKGADSRRLLNVGRKRRTIPPALRRALRARDGGCRFPGCGLRKGIRPDPRTLGARFEKEHHIPTATLFAALEAMG